MAIKKRCDAYASITMEYKVNQDTSDGAYAGAGVCYDTTNYASGDALDGFGYAKVEASQSGKIPLGMLLHDMEEVDLTKYRPNQWDMSQPKGNCASIMTRGWRVTDKLFGTITPGNPCYLHGTGIHSNTLGVGGIIDTPRVGEFMTKKDADGYAKIMYNLPMTQK